MKTYNLKKDPKELSNQIDNPKYQKIIGELKKQLVEIQKNYKVTSKEFEKASTESIKKNYKNFEKLRGNPNIHYGH
ncbi:hypothetical protein BA768_20480 [Chryseobacterium sp. CBo1]|nr:hypothetical protein BA768_20480 [Chryseobacterium sp. CBo1]